jgi:hypothetical protein
MRDHTTTSSPDPTRLVKVIPPARGPSKQRPFVQWFGWLEIFVLVQLLSSGLLLLPGSQSARFAIRALPYVLSIAMLLLVRRTGVRAIRLHASGLWLLAGDVVLVLSLLHPDTPLIAGLAQIVFQVCIAIPLYWTTRATIDERRLRRLVWLTFMCNGISALVGALQVYRPDIYMPRDLTSILSDEYLASLAYEGRDGSVIFRPLGLTDLPGGAATAAALASLTGILILCQERIRSSLRLAATALMLVSVFVLYMTQSRSLVIMLAVAIIVAILLSLRRRQNASAIFLSIVGASSLGVAFVWASHIGGETISDRFLGLLENGVVQSYQDNRGNNVAETFQTLLPRYPLGAGLGRWGMMNTYFGGFSSVSPLQAEIQITGWLFDGGVPYLFVYSAAVFIALFDTCRIAIRHPKSSLGNSAQLIFCINLLITGQAFAGPTFNTQLGIMFWFLTGAVHVSALTKQPPTVRRAKASSKTVARAAVLRLPAGRGRNGDLPTPPV